LIPHPKLSFLLLNKFLDFIWSKGEVFILRMRASCLILRCEILRIEEAFLWITSLNEHLEAGFSIKPVSIETGGILKETYLTHQRRVEWNG